MTDGPDPAFAASPSSPCGSRPSGLQSGVEENDVIERATLALQTSDVPWQRELSEELREIPSTIEAARLALCAMEMARVHHVQPVNGAYDYFYVSFAGQRIEFKLPYHDDRQWFGGEYGPEITALSARAAAAATAINDLLFAAATTAAALAAGSRRAKTPKAVECEASQSGPKGNAHD